MAGAGSHHLPQLSSFFDANTIADYQSSAYISPFFPFPVHFSASCMLHEDDVFSSSNRPPVPDPSEYNIPRRKILNEDVLITERAKEDYICSLFRADGYQFRAELYKDQVKVESLRYLRLWRMINQHLPEFYISEGTRGFEPPVDALLSAIVEDVDLSESELLLAA
jgi:hypothetical protein